MRSRLLNLTKLYILIAAITPFWLFSRAHAQSSCFANDPTNNTITVLDSCSAINWTAGNLTIESGVNITPGTFPAVEVNGAGWVLDNAGNLGEQGIINYSSIGGGVINQITGSIYSITNPNPIGPGPLESGVDNLGSIGIISNSSSIVGLNYGIRNASQIQSIDNQFLIEGLNYTGVVNSGAILSLTNGSGAQIRGSLAIDGFGIQNTGTIGVLQNGGSISGYVGIYNSAQITTLNNQSPDPLTPTASISGVGYGLHNNGGVIGTIMNTEGSTISASSGIGVWNAGVGQITLLENYGTISGIGYGFNAIRNEGTITHLHNQAIGLLSGSNAIENVGTINQITNLGRIEAIDEIGIHNLNAIGSINNQFRITGPTVGIQNGVNASMVAITNAGTIGSDSVNGFYSNLGIFNWAGSISSITNSSLGSISGTGTGILNSVIDDGVQTTSIGFIGTITNHGLIAGGNTYGIENAGRIDAISNDFGATIRSDTSFGRAGIFNRLATFPLDPALSLPSGSIGLIANRGTIEGFEAGIENQSSITQIHNEYGGIINGSSGIYNFAPFGTSPETVVITSLENAGVISGTNLAGRPGDAGIFNSGKFISLKNLSTGEITAPLYGIYNDSTGIITSLTNSGSINANNGGGADSAIFNSGTITTLVNEASGFIGPQSALSSIQAGIKNTFTGYIATLRNYGKIGDLDSPARIPTYGIYNDWFASNGFGEIHNHASIVGGVGIQNSTGATIGSLTNYINAQIQGVTGSGVYTDGVINSVDNRGTITSSSGSGLLNDTNGEIQVVHNSGALVGTVAGIDNRGIIRLLRNSQGAGSPNGALTLVGNLPNVYQIGISAPSVYGQLSLPTTFAVGTMQFEIAPGSVLIPNSSYTSVLSGFYDPNQFNTSTTHDGWLWTLRETSFGSGNWDLTFPTITTGSTVTSADLGVTVNPYFTGGALQLGLSDVINRDFILAGDGTIHTPASGEARINGVISGNGHLTIDGGGSIGVMGLTNTGTISIQNSSVELLSASGLGGDTNVLTLHDATLKSRANFSSARPLALMGTANTIEISSGTNVVLEGSLSGASSFIKRGEGSLILNGMSTNTGDVTVAAGTLKVGQSEAHTTARLGGNIAVQAGALLQGHGMIAGSVSSTGTVQPGGSIGTLTITGNYIQTSSGTLQSDVTPTANSVLNVIGDATIAGGLVINAQSGTYSRKTYTLLSSNRLTGQFGTINTNLASNIRYQINYDAQNVYFEIIHVGPSTADTQSALNTTANYLQSSLIFAKCGACE